MVSEHLPSAGCLNVSDISLQACTALNDSSTHHSPVASSGAPGCGRYMQTSWVYPALLLHHQHCHNH
jgi:hypothetical protein